MAIRSTIIDQSNVELLSTEDDCFKYCQIRNINQDGVNVESDFIGCTFENLDLYWANMACLTFAECEFSNCIFRGADFAGSLFVECTFMNCRFLKDNLNGDCRFGDTRAYGCHAKDCEGIRIKGLTRVGREPEWR